MPKSVRADSRVADALGNLFHVTCLQQRSLWEFHSFFSYKEKKKPLNPRRSDKAPKPCLLYVLVVGGNGERTWSLMFVFGI